jgi:tRNA A-37 threonylcarbamoyl transferase component Bud32
MAEVGSQLPTGRARDCFLSLYALHVGGFAHGDPRLQNIIHYDDRIKWIDVRPTEHFGFTAVFEDVRIIVKSFFNLELSEMANITELANLYSCDISRTAITAVYYACKLAKHNL